jgi:hypothetical protein
MQHARCKMQILVFVEATDGISGHVPDASRSASRYASKFTITLLHVHGSRLLSILNFPAVLPISRSMLACVNPP